METSPQKTSLFNYYNAYKVVISLLLFAMSISQQSFFKDLRFPELFQTLTLSYVFLNIALLFFFRYAIGANPKQIFFSIALDLFFLHGLFFCGSGISIGLANLIVISVAAGNIIIRGRIGLSFAAMATLLTITVESERILAGLNQLKDVTDLGLFGSMYFASAFILQYLSIRISQSELLVKRQEEDLIELQKLNHQIIQSMRTGIIVCNEKGKVDLINQACEDLIGLSNEEQLPELISERINLWLKAPNTRTTPFKMNSDMPLVQANFSHLKENKHSKILVYIEDTRKVSQQAQQLKLASLGRLTASIAHEVRNPLGAISHATQLLAESEHLDAADRKMTDIIQRHSSRVNQIIENTLQLSRRSEPAVENIHLKPWIEKVISEYQLQFPQSKSIDLSIENDEASANFDPDQIEQVLINLIDNGIRHGTKHKPNAVLRVKLSETKGRDQSFIEVIDEGTGISDDNLHHLFEPFFTTESQGTGLGLYLSREICEANQAQLDFIEKAEENTQKPGISKLSSQPNSVLNKTTGTCFRIMFAYNKRII